MKRKLLLSCLIGAISTVSAAEPNTVKENINQLLLRSGAVFSDHKELTDGTIAVSPTNSGSSYHIRNDLERICVASGGNVFMHSKDGFGEDVVLAGFDAQALSQIPPKKLAEFLEYESAKSNMYVVPNDELKKLHSAERTLKGKFSFLDEDKFLRSRNYDTVCRDTQTGNTIYATKTPSEFFYNFEIRIAGVKGADPVLHAEIEDYLAPYILAKKDDRLLLSTRGADGGSTSAVIQKYCDESGGKLILNGTEHRLARSISGVYDSMACSNINTPFVVEAKNKKEYILTKNKLLPSSPKPVVSNTMQQDVFAQAAVMAGGMPIGAGSESKVGNIKMVSTVYADMGTYKLVNVQEAGGNKTYKNYRVQNNEASDITDDRFVYSNLQLPQSIVNAKGSLVQQCSQYGAGKVSIDGYTATCSRQSYNNQCNVNLIYMKKDQFAGREAVGCR